MRKIVVAIRRKRAKSYDKNIKKKQHIERKKQLYEKAKHVDSLRVLFKSPNQEPEVKIIDNLFRLKKAIVEYDLEIIAFQNVYIICHNKDQRKDMQLNIILDFCSIAGDIIVVQIDRHTREFKSLSQENIVWFTEVLNRRCPNNLDTNIYYAQNYYKSNNHNRASINFKIQQSNNFEEKLLDTLSNINSTLTYLITNNKSEVN